MFPDWHTTQFAFEGLDVPFPGWEGTYEDPAIAIAGVVLRDAEQTFVEMEDGDCESKFHRVEGGANPCDEANPCPPPATDYARFSPVIIDGEEFGVKLVCTLSYNTVWSVVLLDSVEDLPEGEAGESVDAPETEYGDPACPPPLTTYSGPC